MKQSELNEILRLHQLWLDNDTKGIRANLRGANLRDANLKGANLKGANLNKADLRGANLNKSNLSYADLSGARMYCTNLRYANLRGAYISDARLRYADLIGANLNRTNLRYANLEGAYMIGSNLNRTNLSNANLSDSNLSGANLRNGNLSGANLRGADLNDSNLSGANLRNTKLDGAKGYKRAVYPEEGSFTCYKKGILDENEYIITLRVPSKAKRVGAIGSRKFRVSEAKVIKIEDMKGKVCNGVEPTGSTYNGIKYVIKETVKPDSFDNSDRVECTHGIHVFITKSEAKEY